MDGLWILVVFVIGSLAAAALVVFALAGYLNPNFQFWPPERGKPWQYHVFWTLFRMFVLALIALCVMDYHGAGSVPIGLAVVGWSVAALGFGTALYLTVFLGWKTAYSVDPQGLRTDGVFARSRNPIYVATLLGMVGLGLAVASWWVTILLALWALFYVFAPLLEEPWLERTYGQDYLDYKRRTPRFF